MESLARSANRGSVSTGYDIDNSLKLEADNSENLYRNLNASTSTTKFTHSMWVKRTELTNAQLLYMRGVAGNESVILRFSGESGYEHGLQVDIGASGTNARSVTTRKFRDPSAWYHIVLAVDTTQSTAANRRRLYVNGEEQSFGMNNTPSQNFSMEVSSAKHRYGAYNDTENYAPFSGYIAECHYIDGSQLDATSFGEFDDDSGIWKPKQYTGSYGTGGYYLDFSDGSDLGANAVGDDVNFTLRNLSSADHASDSPTNNFCCLALPVSTYINTMGATEGGTYMPRNGQNNFAGFFGTMGFTKGKWYFESYIPSRSASYGLMEEMGIHTLGNITLGSPYYVTQMETNYYLNFHYGYTYHWNNGTRVGRAWADTGIPDLGPSAVGSTIGFAINADDGEATWYKDGSQMGTADLDMFDIHDKMQNGVFAVPFFQVYDNNLNANFGGYSSVAISSGNADANGYGNFEYAPPSGYYAICSKNLSEFG